MAGIGGTLNPNYPFAQTGSASQSKQDNLSKLEFFFGPPAHPEKLDLYTEQHAQSFYLPDAYRGQSLKLGETMNNLLLEGPEDWQTSAMLPFLQTDQIRVEWNIARFDQRILQRVPSEGSSRMLTASKNNFRERTVRYGAGISIESDFYRTEAGRKFFSDQMMSLRYCVQMTINHDVMYTLLTVPFYDFNHDLERNLLPRRNVIAAMQHEVAMFACVQKQDRGLDLAVTKTQARMQRYQVNPTAMIIPPEMKLYATMVPDEKTLHYLGGPQAVAEFRTGPDGFGKGKFRGLDVYTSTPFDTGENTDSMQLLRRRTQVGEFYRMRAPPVHDPARGLSPNYLDILIYDEKVDRLAHISALDALRFAMPEESASGDKGPFKDCDGSNNAEKDPLKLKERMTTPVKTKILQSVTDTVLKTYLKVVDSNGTYANVKATDLAALLAEVDALVGPNKTFDYTYAKFEQLFQLAAIGIWFPLQIVVARPFIEHEMFSSIVAVAGSDTGATIFGHADMQIAANTSVKVIEAHYTCHTKAIVTRPQNVNIMRDIMCASYEAGADARFFGSRDPDTGEVVTGRAKAQNIRKAVRSRLEFQKEYSDLYESMFAFLAPWDANDQFMQDNAFSLLGNSGLPWDTGTGTNVAAAAGAGGRGEHADVNFPGGYANWFRYDALLQLRQIHTGEDQGQRQRQDFVRTGSFNNSVCLLGPHRVYAPFSEKQFDLVPGQGHFGPDALPGDARWRRGESISAKDARGQLVGLEVAASVKSSIMAD